MAQASGERSTALDELTPSTAGFAHVLVKVHRSSQPHEYTYTWQGQTKHGKRQEYVLVSTDSNSYCIGLITRRGAGATAETAFKKATERFVVGTVSKLTKVVFAKQKPAYVGVPVKSVIDLAQTKCAPVLQSTVFMPPQPTPAEDLVTILDMREPQRVDVTCLVRSIENERTAVTAQGQRRIVDVTLLDGSEQEGKKVSTSFARFLPMTAEGEAQLKVLREGQAQSSPISFFGLTCVPHPSSASEHADKMKISISQTFYMEKCEHGAKCARLTGQREELQAIKGEGLTEIARIAEWTPQESIDWTAENAILSSCALLDAAMQGGFPLFERSAAEHESRILLQINHVRLLPPAIGEEVTTKDGSRLFVPVQMMDQSGSVNVRMREKAALEVTGHATKEKFVEASRQGGVCFPILSSVRVLVSPEKEKQAGQASDSGASEHERQLNAIVMEAVEQDINPKCTPNAATLQMTALLKLLPRPTDHILVARVSEIDASPYTGLVVGPRRIPCKCVLTMIASTEKSNMENIEGGFRLLTKNVLECVFAPTSDRDAEEVPVSMEFCSMCTLENLTDYKLNPTSPGQKLHALVVIGALKKRDVGAPTCIVDTVRQLAPHDVPAYKKMLQRLSLISGATDYQGTKRQVAWPDYMSPYSGKKTRRLGENPTDQSLGDSLEANASGE